MSDLETLAREFIGGHFYLDEDSWYSCGLHPDCSDERNIGQCNCGLENRVAALTALLRRVQGRDTGRELQGEVYALNAARQSPTVKALKGEA